MKRIICLLLTLVMALSLAACGQEAGEASVQSVSMICGLGSVGRVDRFSGVVTPKGERAVNAADGSAIGEIKVEVGDAVTEGQVLFTYDTEKTRSDLERKQLERQQQENTLANKAEQREELEKQMKEADKSQKRQYLLDIQNLDVDVEEIKYDIGMKDKEIAKLSALLQNSSVTSPVSGTVQAVNENGGTDMNGNSLPLISLVEDGGYRVKGYVNENNAAALNEGMSVLLRSRVDDTVWHGSIESIDFSNPVKDDNNYYYVGMSDDTVNSSKYAFYVTLGAGDKDLMMGQHLYIEPDYGQDAAADASVIHLPEWYINDADSNPWVWAQDKNGKLEKRHLKLGEYDADMGTYPVEDGLTAEDYIAFPDDTLSVGMTCIEYDESTFAGEFSEGEFADEEMVDGLMEAPAVVGGAVSGGMVTEDVMEVPAAEASVPAVG